MLTLSLCAAENFEEVMEFYMPMVYRIAFARLADRSDAEDVTQDVFLRYFRTGLTYESEEHRKAWLIRCAVNCAKNVAGSAWNRHRSRGERADGFLLRGAVRKNRKAARRDERGDEAARKIPHGDTPVLL